MKLFWTGTDSLMLVDYSMRRPIKRIYWWFFRRFVRVAEYFIQGHLCISDNLNEHLIEFGVKKPIGHIDTPLKYTKKIHKIPHDTFTVLYYYPSSGDKEFIDWLYGRDVFDIVCMSLPELKYVIVSGDSDMSVIYPYVDFYIRPNRHDGPSRMRMECEIQDIPYYWTQNDPSVDDAIKAIKDVEKDFSNRG